MPWVLVNGVPLFEHDPEVKLYVCAAFSGRKPSSCWQPDNAEAGPLAAQVQAQALGADPKVGVPALAAIPHGHSPAGHTAHQDWQA